jgi:hypothetical protein
VACACASENKEKGREAGRCELLGRRLGRGKKKEREREGWGFGVFFFFFKIFSNSFSNF